MPDRYGNHHCSEITFVMRMCYCYIIGIEKFVEVNRSSLTCDLSVIPYLRTLAFKLTLASILTLAFKLTLAFIRIRMYVQAYITV